MNKRIVAAVMALGLVLTMNAETFADPALDAKLNESKNKYKQSQNTLDAAQKKAKDVEANIEMLDNQIQQSMNQIDNIKTKINKAEADKNAAEQNIKKSEADIKLEQELYNKRIRALYMSGSNENLSILLDSKGINDFISKVEIIKKISEFNSKIISNLNERKQELQQKKDKLSSKKEKLAALQSDSQKRLKDLNNQKVAELPIIAEAKAEENSATELNASLQTQIAAINQKITALRITEATATKANTNSNLSINRGESVSSLSYSSDAIIAYAASFLGTPYVWGGTSPKPGFDCSGFTQYVYKKFGVTLGRTTYDQIKDGTEVSRNQLQPGDLVFFGTFENPHHMGMYIGNGMYIHAPHTGDVIKISPVDRTDYVVARRVR